MSEEPVEYVDIEAEHVHVAKAEQKANKNIALAGLITITLICVVGIASSIILPVIFEGLDDVPDDALQPLTTLALLGMGALSTMLGGGNGNGKH